MPNEAISFVTDKTFYKEMTLNEYQNHALETAIYPEKYKKGGSIK